MELPKGLPTSNADYASRLERLQNTPWKRWLGVQAPYRWHVRSLELGYVLDVGCGIGRNLAHLDGNGVGVDHNHQAVVASRNRGFKAYTNAEWSSAPEARPGVFDSMLVAHVVEHMSEEDATRLVSSQLDYVRSGGKVVFITPQERGYASDATHVRFVGFGELDRLCASTGLRPSLRRSFPFPRAVGSIFKYNEFVTVAVKP